MNQELTISGADGNFSAYMALPVLSPSAAIIVIQEIFGLNESVRQVADYYAEAGFLAIAPDLYWRQEPGLQLSEQSAYDRGKAFALYQNFDEANGVLDLMETLQTLRKHPACTGKIGTVGFCLGGKLAYLMATRSDADCNVGYYGVAIEQNLAESTQIAAPLMLHLAQIDRFVSAEAQAEIISTLQNNPFATVYSYPNTQHGFARSGSQSFHSEAAAAAHDRTLQFFRQQLQSSC